MPIKVTSSNPAALVEAIKKDIKDKRIDTWTHVSDAKGDWFTHNPPQFDKKAWISTTVGTGDVTFTVNIQDSGKSEPRLYGIYEGRFVEMLLNHCRTPAKYTGIAVN